ncbi:tRNA pseudouridine(38-40) synthase TruA [Desertivirga xinjiangensis]|uniref:tRNA pseudouridine(38-40) synthase TruA n=1 Tax=Desertivirga xinjiangensis TaxID=539206 RepID=UPI00210A3D2C|nr:tRNA pseudouridine(38-40) synthase TruA [Pedobacter xinjiangensis]
MHRQRYFLELAYKGTVYHGWQIQPNAVSVQEILEKALSTLFRQKIETVGCGRTDTGVHASQFFAHFDCVGPDVGRDSLEARYLTSLNALLPYDIAVKRIIRVNDDAHARFDATQRSYQYFIHHHKDPFKHNFSWLVKESLDVAEMTKAASYLLDYTDFSCFSKSNTQVFTNNCKIENAEWQKNEDGLIFVISADRFLRNMVRAIVGTLVEIGRHKLRAEAIHQIIQSKDRSNAGTSVPACGLYLTKIQYPYI